jgi:lipoyl synthase
MNRTDLQEREAERHRGPRPSARLPEHCRSSTPPSVASNELRRRLRRSGLRTVCEEARCPNLTRCFAEGTATFMLLGDVCTRTCRFCNVATGHPRPVEADEPERVASAVCELGLHHVVLTSVNRDDLPREDQGSLQFARSIRAIRARAPEVTVEVLTPDFQGEAAAIERVAAAGPDVYNHNVETVPRLYASVRPGARYVRSLGLLERVRGLASEARSEAKPSGGRASEARSEAKPSGGRRRIWTKSGLMLGLGESRAEVSQVLRDLRAVGVDCVTLGQYLRPTLRHLEVARYLEPAEFEELGAEARALGFAHVAAGPLVRSSFHADDALRWLRRGRTGMEASDVAL